MQNVISFNNELEWEIYLNSRVNKTDKLGSGGEGTCYLSYKDGKVYKKIENNFFKPKYDLECLVSLTTINLPSFALPIEIFIVNGSLVGYTSEYILGDIILPHPFNKNGQIYTHDHTIYDINYDVLLDSYKKMLIDVKQLSRYNIVANDLPFNLTFNNLHLCAIDPTQYSFENINPEVKNIELYENAIKRELELMEYAIYKDIYSYISAEECINHYKELKLKRK